MSKNNAPSTEWRECMRECLVHTTHTHTNEREKVHIIIRKLCNCEWVASIKRSRSEIKEERMGKWREKTRTHNAHCAHIIEHREECLFVTTSKKFFGFFLSLSCVHSDRCGIYSILSAFFSQLVVNVNTHMSVWVNLRVHKSKSLEWLCLFCVRTRFGCHHYLLAWFVLLPFKVSNVRHRRQ